MQDLAGEGVPVSGRVLVGGVVGQLVRELADPGWARLDVVHAWGLPGLEDDPDRARARGRAGAHVEEVRLRAALTAAGATSTESADPQVTVSTPLGPAAERLVEATSLSDLLVLGRHDPRIPLGSHLGPVVGAVLREARCPVLLVDLGRQR